MITEEQSKKSIENGTTIKKKSESLDTDAPLSRKERKRRKEVAMSQKSAMDFSAGSNATPSEYIAFVKKVN